MKCYVTTRFSEYHEGFPTLRASGADAGGGSEGIVCMSAYWTNQRISEFVQAGVSSTLAARDFKSARDLLQEDSMEGNQRKYVLRRLTPIECARLQGFPDWWCDGAEGSDSSQYRLWGNGIGLPCASDILGRCAKALGSDKK